MEIINAAWFYKIYWQGKQCSVTDKVEDRYINKDTQNRLVLKAIEYSHIEKYYNDFIPQSYVIRENNFSSTVMSVLTKDSILECMRRPEINKCLVITPLLNTDSFDPSSVDVRLGTEFIVIKKQYFPLLDVAYKSEEEEEELNLNVRKYQQKVRINYKERFVLHPRQLIIGSTFEYVQIPPDLMCYVIGKSSWRRMGLIIATATKVDPGFKGCITLEIINEGEVPVVLYPGIPIAQLVFHHVQPDAKYKGHYQYSTGPQFPNFPLNNKDWQFWTEIIKKTS